MPGFAELLEYLAAADARGKSLVKTMDNVGAAIDLTPIQRAQAEVDRLTAAIAEMTADARGDRTTSGLAEQLAEAQKRVELLTAGGALPGARVTDSLGPVLETASPVQRLELSMRAMAETAKVAAEETAQIIDEVTAKADAAQIKISKSLAAILDPGSEEGLSGNYDEKTGQFLGGAFSYERALAEVERFNELLDLQRQKLTAADTYYVNDSLKKTAEQFRAEFGKLGDIRTLAKQLREYMAAVEKRDAALGSTSGTLGSSRTTTNTPTSLAVLRWQGLYR
jgi:hypothetical protein